MKRPEFEKLNRTPAVVQLSRLLTPEQRRERDNAKRAKNKRLQRIYDPETVRAAEKKYRANRKAKQQT